MRRALLLAVAVAVLAFGAAGAGAGTADGKWLTVRQARHVLSTQVTHA
jgi:hypothetical protein